jgi:hydrogenase maturation factor
MLAEFAVLYPYLQLIAHENGINDPFDKKVVEAYWIGNELLNNVGMRSFSDHLLYKQRLKERVTKKALKWIIEKIPNGAYVHHSFHVFSIFTRTGHQQVPHTLDTMDQCRIGWGKIIKIDNSISKKPVIKLLSQKLIFQKGKLDIKDRVERNVVLPVINNYTKRLKTGDWITFHWGFVCDKIKEFQVRQLKYFTLFNLNLANDTI